MPTERDRYKCKVINQMVTIKHVSETIEEIDEEGNATARTRHLGVACSGMYTCVQLRSRDACQHPELRTTPPAPGEEDDSL